MRCGPQTWTPMGSTLPARPTIPPPTRTHTLISCMRSSLRRPRFRPSAQVDPESEGALLPRHTQDESKPAFTPRVGEFKFWKQSMEGIAFAFFLTFFSMFDVLVYWPILVLYFILLFVITMQKKIAHMIKWKCVSPSPPLASRALPATRPLPSPKPTLPARTLALSPTSLTGISRAPARPKNNTAGEKRQSPQLAPSSQAPAGNEGGNQPTPFVQPTYFPLPQEFRTFLLFFFFFFFFFFLQHTR